MAAHRVNRDNAPLHKQQVEQGGDRRDFIALGIGFHLPKHDAVGARPGTDRVNRRLARPSVVRTPGRFAVHRDHRSVCLRHYRLHPGKKTKVELHGVKGGKDVAKGIVGGNAVGKIEKTGKPILLGLTKLRDLHPRVRAADHGTQGNRENGEQGVIAPTVSTRVRERGKVCG